MYFYLADYDNDGKNEAFAAVGTPVNTYAGVEIYFVNADSAELLTRNIGIDTNVGGQGFCPEKGIDADTGGGNLLVTPEYAFLSFPGGVTYDDICYIWGVKAGKPYEVNITKQYTRVYQGSSTGAIDGFKTVYDDQGIGSSKQYYEFSFDNTAMAFSASEIKTPELVPTTP